MTDLELMRRFVSLEMRHTLQLGIKMFLLSYDRASSYELAHYFDRDVRVITESMANLKRGGWVDIVDFQLNYNLTMNSQVGKLMRSTSRTAVYVASDQLKRFVNDD